MKIGIFLPTGTRGYLISTNAPLNEPTFALNRRVVQAAERYGCEFALSMVKFRGFGGPSRYWDGALEPFTLISALAAVSERIQLFATAASLAMPPAIVARMIATIDSVAPGRVGVNLITGWQKAEYDQMGLWPGQAHFEHRYAYLGEYVSVMKELWETGRSDRKGSFFTMDDCQLEPRPAHPVPLVVAGSSDNGMRFAAEHCDYNFCSTPGAINDPDVCGGTVLRLREAAAAAGRQVSALVWVSVIAAETDEAAHARWDHYRAGVDLVALGWHAGQASADPSKDPNSAVNRKPAGAAPSPYNGFKLIGSYDTVAALLDRMAEIEGLSGVMLSFDDYDAGIEQFGQYIQPRMRSRQHVQVAA